jgi:putative ABC transport system ATP-binding protein
VSILSTIETLPDQIASATDLTKTYGTGEAVVRALDGVSVGFARGSFTAIMGPSGSGKSTLMHCLAGLDRPTSGRVVLGGNVLSELTDRALTNVRRDNVGFVFQAFNLLPTLTALQNIVLPLDLAGRRADQAALDQIVESLGLGNRLSHLPSQLSGGQQQRVAIARALITDPAILLADEPTGNLDSRVSEEIMAILQELNEQGRTVIIITHEPDIAQFAGRAVAFRDGRIVSDQRVVDRRVARRKESAA